MKCLSRASRFAAACAASALVLAACGDDSSSSEGCTARAATSRRARHPPSPRATVSSRSAPCCPQTGDLAFLGPPEFAGVQPAVDEINEAGGVLGKPVKKIDADSGDGTPDIAGGEVDNLLSEDVDTIIGAAASGVSVSVIDKITGAGVVQFSPANTAAGFDTYEDTGLYFRTAPSDILQGQLLANLVVEDGFENVAIWVARTSTARASRRPCVTGRGEGRCGQRVRPVRR